MRTLVVTGGIGSGKSAVCAILESMGYAVYDSDSRARNLYDSCPEVLSKVERALGCSLRNERGTFSPRKLSQRIFSDKESLEMVEDIVHPAVFEDFRKWKEQLGATAVSDTESSLKTDFCVFESAIYLSLDSSYALDDADILYVDAPKEIRLERVKRRNPQMRPEEILQRMDCQKSSAEDPRITYMIDNSSDFKTLKEEVEKLAAVLK